MNKPNTHELTCGHRGKYRFCNLLFFTYILDYFARLNDSAIEFVDKARIESLGIYLFSSGKNVHRERCIVSDNEIDIVLNNPELVANKTVYLREYVQTSMCARYIKELINTNKKYIKRKNKNNYNNNNLFIHVRLGDIANDNRAQPFEYYDTAIKAIQIEKGFISSDTISHDTCKKLIEKYNLKVFEGDEVETIQFGSSCKSIVLSHGTFSWFIGAFSFNSNVYYPEIKFKWHGDIFIFPEWNKIS